MRVSGAEPRARASGSAPSMVRIIGSEAREPRSPRAIGALLLAPNAESLPLSTGLRTDRCTPFCGRGQIQAGRPARNSYGQNVLRDSKEKRSMEPRQLRLPGFTRLWAPDARWRIIASVAGRRRPQVSQSRIARRDAEAQRCRRLLQRLCVSASLREQRDCRAASRLAMLERLWLRFRQLQTL